MKRTVIEIDEELCDGCGNCAGGCHEGALQIIDGKARLIGESLCDGLGACIGECPRGAITVTEKDAEEYDERRVIEHILPKGAATLTAHLKHLRDHGQDTWLAQGIAALKEKGIVLPGFETALGAIKPARKEAPIYSAAPLNAPQATIQPQGFSGCPGSMARSFSSGAPSPTVKSSAPSTGGGMASRLEQWPVQLHLINPRAPYFQGADILIAADCTAFACGAFHQALLAGRRLVIACPKLDSGKEIYVDKIRALVNESGAASLTVAIMDVPCCGGLKRIVDDALAGATRDLPVNTVVVSSQGGSLSWL
ncbi:MAG TPA: 4Fe-4S ferredoxin [Spirochaetaceae bacterium]|jgi:ferredoxin|nr:4Fe-4S ferredoxin [Spirochaetaceae bacterium]